MFMQMIDVIGEWIRGTGIVSLESEFSILVTCITLLGMMVAVFAWCFRKICWGIRVLRQQKPIDCLARSLAGHSIVSKKELIYQIRCFVPPHFTDKRKTIKGLQSDILSASGEKKSLAAVFSVVGAPACGKTTVMRYLYCQLAKRRNCVYFQMQNVTNMEELSRYLYDQSANFTDREPVIAFFDGVDEACEFFQSESQASMEEVFRAFFFQGIYSKIYEVFQKNNLILDCVVISLRPEFLERSIQSIESFQNYIDSKVYKIAPMSDKEVIRIYKSLKDLKRLDYKLETKKQRHQIRYPSILQSHKYIRIFRRILKNNPNSIFRYPMYIRYAYAFMQTYEERDGALDSNNIAVSFDVLVSAIIKWEFHVYYKKSKVGHEEEINQFTKCLEKATKEIAKRLTDNRLSQTKFWMYLTKEQFQEIIKEYFKNENERLVFSHCLMVSDDNGEYFSFSHFTLYEYFLAKYLFDDADIMYRKAQLFSPMATDYLRDMYYSILCNDTSLNKKISESLRITPQEGKITINDCHALENGKEIEIKDTPEISLVEIFEYLPGIYSFMYRNYVFEKDNLEKMASIGMLDLEYTDWDNLNTTCHVIPNQRLERLGISELPLKDVSAIEQYSNLKYIRMQFQNEEAPILDDILDKIQNLYLDEINIVSREGILLEKIYDSLCEQRIHINNIYIETKNYSKEHLRMYEINKNMEKAGQSVCFFPSLRSDKKLALDIYNKNSYNEKIEIMEAVFALESDNRGMLGMRDGDAEATYWNGMCLASYYSKRGEVDQAYQICHELASYIVQEETEISVRFGGLYGDILMSKGEFSLARCWLGTTYKYSDVCGNCGRSNVCKVKRGLDYYEARIRSEGHGVKEVNEDLENRICKLPDKQRYVMDTRLIQLRCVEKLQWWKMGENEPEELEDLILHYQQSAVALYENGGGCGEKFLAIIYELVCANRLEDFERGKHLLEVLKHILQSENDDSTWKYLNRSTAWQLYCIEKIYHLFLKGEREHIWNILSGAEEYLSIEVIDYMRQYCQGLGGVEMEGIIKFYFWNQLCY